mmetsp:Transcript_29856/g.84094  ORF Transcript_29856/g.84094 Transcript_29856/m.84094 type:complete len:275 (+) Transcript_29856:85-909(+)
MRVVTTSVLLPVWPCASPRTAAAEQAGHSQALAAAADAAAGAGLPGRATAAAAASLRWGLPGRGATITSTIAASSPTTLAASSSRTTTLATFTPSSLPACRLAVAATAALRRPRGQQPQDGLHEWHWRSIILECCDLLILWEAPVCEADELLLCILQGSPVLFQEIQELRKRTGGEAVTSTILTQLCIRSVIAKETVDALGRPLQGLSCAATPVLRTLQLLGFVRQPRVKLAMEAGEDGLERDHVEHGVRLVSLRKLARRRGRRRALPRAFSQR